MNIDREIRKARRFVGLEPPSFIEQVAPALGIFALGLLAGAGVALVLTPMSGDKLRERIGDTVGSYRARMRLQGGVTSDKAEYDSGRLNAKQAEPYRA